MAEVKSETAPEVITRTVTVVTTRGEKKKIAFTGDKWSELKKILTKEGYNVNPEQTKCVEGVTRRTLEHPEALVPDKDFVLFLMPYKNKSGAEMDRATCYAKIKKFKEGKNSEAAIAHFGNHTTKSTGTLNELIESFPEGKGSGSRVSAAKGKAISDVVTSVEANALYEEVSKLSPQDQMYLVIKLLTEINNKLPGTAIAVAPTSASTGTVAEAPKKPAEPVETPQQKADREKKEEEDRLEEEENKRLEEEMGGMMSGFSDVDKNKGRR